MEDVLRSRWESTSVRHAFIRKVKICLRQPSMQWLNCGFLGFFGVGGGWGVPVAKTFCSAPPRRRHVQRSLVKSVTASCCSVWSAGLHDFGCAACSHHLSRRRIYVCVSVSCTEVSTVQHSAVSLMTREGQMSGVIPPMCVLSQGASETVCPQVPQHLLGFFVSCDIIRKHDDK